MRTVDYVDRFFKKIKEHKLIVIVIIGFVVICGIANFLGALNVIGQFFIPPSSNLDVAIYGSKIYLVKSQNDTTVIGFNTTVNMQITNTGEIPVTIVACDVFLKNHEIPDSEPISKIKYLQPNDSFDYNFTKNIEVSIPIISGTIDLTEFTFIVMYRDTSGNIKTVWRDFEKPL